jgi:hypothetical protein
VDKWYLVVLANTMPTEVRQRVTRQLLGRRGSTADSVWVNRRLLLTGADHLSAKRWIRLTATRLITVEGVGRSARRPRGRCRGLPKMEVPTPSGRPRRG